MQIEVNGSDRFNERGPRLATSQRMRLATLQRMLTPHRTCLSLHTDWALTGIIASLEICYSNEHVDVRLPGVSRIGLSLESIM